MTFLGYPPYGIASAKTYCKYIIFAALIHIFIERTYILSLRPGERPSKAAVSKLVLHAAISLLSL